LESFRADDIHALHAAALSHCAVRLPPRPSEDQSRGASPSSCLSIPPTAHAVPVFGGLGALPFQLALSRDLVDLPLRCAPDVLRDAGFETRLYYGGSVSFDHLGEFAAHHGLAVSDLSSLPPDLPKGAFRAVTDRALFGVALRDSAQVGPFAYRFVLTLSGHTPFDIPEECPGGTRSARAMTSPNTFAPSTPKIAGGS
jgi:hypothetical protein